MIAIVCKECEEEKDIVCKGLCRSCYNKAYNALPGFKAIKKQYDKEYLSQPRIKAIRKDYDRKYYARPEVKARVKEYESTEEFITRRKELRRLN